MGDGGPDGETVNAGGSKDSKKEKGEKSGHRVTSWQISVVLNNGEILAVWVVRSATMFRFVRKVTTTVRARRLKYT